MSYFLLTGATGLLGRYLLRDLTQADLRLAVVVRPTRWESAAQRIETAMARWENELGYGLVRPVVLEGDISEPLLGLNEADIAWVAKNCHAMIHSAASLTFHAEEKTGEPERSNLQGTHNVIELCRHAGIREMHHVSTAYVCGRRRGRILESELDVGQETGNDYERTKLAAEKKVLASDAFSQVTVYRPAIIVGDSQTGFTTSYHGFYTPLRLVHSLLQTVPWEVILQGDWLGGLQLAGDERKNLVSVDWVSAAMTWLIAHPELHGNTYHLTNPAPATALSMQSAFLEALAEVVQSQKPSGSIKTVAQEVVATFREQMSIYQAYWSDDPQFDSSRTELALPHLPCPQVDQSVMHRLIRFAIGENFGWPREAALVPERDAADWIACFGSIEEHSEITAAQRAINLHVSGPGGGQWNLAIEQGRVIGADRGLNPHAPTCYLNTATFFALTRGELSLEDAIDAGRLVVVGKEACLGDLARMFRAPLTNNEERILEKATIG